VPDVIVIGAGLAGLSCARDLAEAGADVLVVEARERPGGCTERVALPSGDVDGGGELIGSFHEPALRLIEELGLELEPAHPSLPGDGVWLFDDRRVAGPADELLAGDDARALEQLEQRLLEIAAEIDPAEPWAHPDAERLDALSYAAYARELGATEAVLDLLRLDSLAVACDAPERTSALSVLQRYATGHVPSDLAAWETFRLVGGTFQLAERLAAELAGRVRYRAAVLRIGAQAGAVELNLATGESLRADACVTTIPAGALHGVALDGLSDATLRAARRLRQARAAKVVLRYETSFWAEAGYSGASLSSRTVGSTWEQRPGVLSALVPPERVGYFASLSPERRRAEVLDHVSALFGPDAPPPLDMVVRLWAEDPYTRGYSAVREPGAITAIGEALLPGAQRVLFAGADVAPVAGYMTGAVDTGRRAAATLVAAAATA
jgi:monoamine oxidase